jgi:hypothetical protein
MEFELRVISTLSAKYLSSGLFFVVAAV